MKKSAEERLAELVAKMPHRRVTEEALAMEKKRRNLTDEDIFGKLDSVEKKEVLGDMNLFRKWVELVETEKLTNDYDRFVSLVKKGGKDESI